MKPVAKLWYNSQGELRLLKEWKGPATEDYAGTDMHAVEVQNWKDESLLVVNASDIKIPTILPGVTDTFFDLPGATWEEQRSRVESDEIFYAYIHLPKERGVARQPDIAEMVIQAQIGTKSQAEFIESYKRDYFKRWPSYYPRLTDLEWYHLFLDAYDAIEKHCVNDLQDQFAAAHKRIEELEAELKRYQDMVGDTYKKIHE